VGYVVRKGVPEILELWKRLLHPGLNTHDISDLTRRYGRKVFQSYLENNTPSAARMYWVYGPEDGQLTVIGLEPHPEDKKNRAYDRVRLSRLPPPDPPIGSRNRKKGGPRGKR
jgi:hypothetical protein